MNRARMETAESERAIAEGRLQDARAHAAIALERLDKALLRHRDRPAATLRDLALTAYETHLRVAQVWTQASWLEVARLEVEAAKRGRRRPRGPGWPAPGDVLNARRRPGQRGDGKK